MIMSGGKQTVTFFLSLCREMAKTKTTSGEPLKKCPFCNYKTSRYSEWKDHMAECYQKRHFCNKCDYSTDKKVNYLRHLKRNHVEQADENQNIVQRQCSDNSETHSAREQCGQESSDEEEWLSQEPDIAIEDEPDVTEDSNSADIPSSSHDQDDRLVLEATTRKRTQPLPVYTPSRPKTPRLESVTTDVAVHTVDVGVQTDPVLYTKSIKTTTIVKEQGRKIVTVKREKML